MSSHASDEFWYSNPPNTFLQNNRLTVAPVMSAFQQVFATINGLYVGSFVPFPIVYFGGIDPLNGERKSLEKGKNDGGRKGKWGNGVSGD